MCGIVGMLGDLSYSDKAVFKDLMAFSIVRGEDSAGFAAVDNYDEVSWAKCVGTSYDLFHTSPFEKLSAGGSKVLIGHTRKATVGGISKYTAHPFNYGNVTGVHNGTLDHWRWKDLPCGPEATDSATLYKSISEIGLRETIEQIAGAWACVYYDESDKTVNIVRNKERTLFYCMSKDYKRLLWASEPWMLFVAVARSNFDMADLAGKGEEGKFVLPFEADNWYKIKVAGSGTNPITFLETEALKGDLRRPTRPLASSRWTPPDPFGSNGTSALTKVEKSEDNQPQKPQVESTPKVDGLVTTKTHTSSSLSPEAERMKSSLRSSTASPSPKPTLSLVPTNKGDTSGQSKGQPAKSEKTDVILVEADDLDDDIPGIEATPKKREVLDVYGHPMTAQDWRDASVDAQCQFCGVDVEHADALEHNGGATHIPGVGRWLSKKEFLCTTCVTTI